MSDHLSAFGVRPVHSRLVQRRKYRFKWTWRWTNETVTMDAKPHSSKKSVLFNPQISKIRHNVLRYEINSEIKTQPLY